MAIRALSLGRRLESFSPDLVQQYAPAVAWGAFRWLAWGAGIALWYVVAEGDLLGSAAVLLLAASIGVGVAATGLVARPRPSYLLRLGVAAVDVVLAAMLMGFTGGLESPFLPYAFAVVMGAGWLLGVFEGLAGAAAAGLLAWGPPEASGPYLSAMVALLAFGGLGRWIGNQAHILAERGALSSRVAMLERRMAASRDTRHRAAARVMSSLEPDRVYEAAAAVAREVLRAERTTILLADEGTGELRPVHVEGGSGQVSVRRFAVPVSGPAEWAADERRLKELLRERGLAADLAAPMQTQNRLLGVLAVERPSEVATLADQDTLNTLADVTASALAAARVHVERIGAQRREVLRQAELGESLISLQTAIAPATDARDIARRVAAELVGALRAARAGVFLVSEHGNAANLAAVNGLGWDDARTLPSYVELSEDQPLAIRAIRARKLLTCGPRESELLMGEPEQAGSAIAVPLLVGDEIVGAAFVEAHGGERQWRDPEQRYLRILAHQVGLAVRRAQVHRNAERRSTQLQSIYQAAQAINAEVEPSSALANIAEQAAAVEGTYLAGVVLTETDRPVLHVFIRPDGQRREIELDLGHDFFASAIATREPRAARNPRELPPELLELGPLSSALAMPMVLGQRAIGLLVVGQASEAMGSPDFDLAFLRYLASQATLAVTRARLFDQTRLEERHNATLQQVGQIISSSLDLRDALRAVADLAAEAVESDRASVYLFDGRQYLAPIAAVGFDAETEQAFKTIALEVDADAFTREVVRQKRAVQVDARALNEGRVAMWPLLQADVRRLLGIPLVAGEQVVGALFIHERHPRRTFASEEIELLLGVARQAAVAVENDELGAEAREGLRREQLLAACARDLAGGRDVEHRLSAMLERMAEVLPIKAGTVAVLERQHLKVMAAYGVPSGSDQSGVNRLPDGREMAEWLADEGRPFVSGGSRASGQGQTDWSYLALPISAGGQPLGVLHVESERAAAFGDRELGLLSAVASQVGGALIREQLRRQIQELSRWQQQALEARTMQEGAGRLLGSAIIKLGAADMLVEVDHEQAVEELRQAKNLAADALQQLNTGVGMLAPAATTTSTALPDGRTNA